MATPTNALPPSYARVSLAIITSEREANLLGNIHGGEIMKLADSTAGAVAQRHSGGPAVTAAMDSLRLAAFVYPTWSNPPRLIGDLNTPHGDNSQFFSPTTGFPAIQVPMGYTRDGRLPAGVTFFGRAWDETTLISLAYSYEQHTKHRRPPVSAPPLSAK